MAAAFAAAHVAAGVPALVPMPREIKVAPGECVLKGAPTVEIDDAIAREGYELYITTDGVTIRHSDAAGLFYANKTLEQLRSPGKAALPCVEIKDAPAFRWRGVHLDDVRHFFGKGTVKRILGEIAQYKFNVFHWHLTDDQAWLLDIPGYPELVRQGKGMELGESVGPFRYTDNDIKEVLAYAAERHITVVPEVEFPGHFAAARRAYPDFACPGGGRVMCIGNPEAVKFAERVLDRVCELFPSEVVHIGGDECKREYWEKCPRCLALMEREGMQNAGELQQWLSRHLAEYLAAKGRRAIGWDEIFDSGAVLPSGAMGMCWRPADGTGVEGAGSGAGVANAGHEVVMCPYSHCYFDYSQGLEEDPFDYFLLGKRTSTLENVYSFDPLAGVVPEARRFVAGGQCNNWSERTLGLADLEWKLWPRALALAEVLWTYPDPAKRDYAEFSRRAEEHRRRLLRDHVNCAGIANRKTERAAQ